MQVKTQLANQLKSLKKTVARLTNVNKFYGEGRYRGVMAQEVPEYSSKDSNGYLMVDYSDLDVKFERIY